MEESSLEESPQKDELLYYHKKIRRLEQMIARRKKRENTLAVLRVLSFLLMIALPVALVQAGWMKPVTTSVALASSSPLVLFILSLVFFRRVRAGRLRTHRLLLDCYQGMARLDDSWMEKAPRHDFASIPDDDHPFEQDAGVFGDYSLFRYLDRTITEGGRLRLAEVLRGPAGEHQDREQDRRVAVRELSRRRVIQNRLLSSLQKPEALSPAMPDVQELSRALKGIRSSLLLLIPSIILPPISLVTLIFHSDPSVMPLFLVLYPLQIVLFVIGHFMNRSNLESAARFANEIQDLSRVMSGLRNVRFESKRLSRLSILEKDSAHEASRLASLLGVGQLRENPFLYAIMGILFLYEIPLVYVLENWKNRYADHLDSWLGDLYELDSFLSLALFASDHPDYAWAEQREAAEIEGVELGQILIPASRRVGNTVRIGHENGVWILTGSNMSGKSTLLRSVAQAIILSAAGAPVPAKSFSYGSLQLMTSIQVSDDPSRSLSLFYAEVRRIRRLLEIACTSDRPPLLFLVDEMFRGTNNRERLIASRTVIQELQKCGARGIIATHDLELTELCGQHATSESPGVVCKHFQESIHEGVMHFDYRLKDGPVSGTNALKILASEGIPVPS